MSEKSAQNLAIDWLISNLRWGWLLSIYVLVILSVPLPQTGWPIVYMLPAIGIVYNLIFAGLLYVGWFPKWLGVGSILLDTLLGIVLMLASGSKELFLLPALVFPIITSVLYLNVETGLLVTALPVTLAYAGYMVLKRDIDFQLSKVLSDVLLLFGSGIIAGYISQRQLRNKNETDEGVIKKLRVENERAQAIYEMANTLSSTLNYRNVLSAVVELAHLALSEANGGTSQDKSTVGMVLLFEGDVKERKLKLVAGRNIPRLDESSKVEAQEGVLAQVILKAEAITSGDIQGDPVLMQFASLASCHSMVCAPLRAGFDLWGVVLFAHPQYNIYTHEHASLLTTFCNQAIIALQNAQLYEDLAREQKKLLEKEAQARRELARNLHDGPTQSVAAIAMRLNFVQKLIEKENNLEKTQDEISKIEKIALRTTQEIRNMLFTLRPVVLETQGLAAALRQYADRLKDFDKLNVDLDIEKYDGQLSTDEEGVIFTIIEEAVGNAKKYARAEQIRIKLASQNDSVMAEIIDNGKGFDVDSVKATYDQRGSLGLLNMDERARMVGGRCTIQSTKGKGTLVRVEVPIRS